ncbi:unnamed protein product [Chrysoparadoxa australica]
MGAPDDADKVHTIKGVPTSCIVRIGDGEEGGGVAPDNSAASKRGHSTVAVGPKEFEVDVVLDTREDHDDVVFQEVFGTSSGNADGVRPQLLKALVEDAVSACVIVTGSHSSSKRTLFQGEVGAGASGHGAEEARTGVLGWVLDPLLGLLRDRSFSTMGFYEFKLTFSFCEVFEEIIYDLLHTENDNLRVQMDPLKGHHVEGLTSHEIGSAVDAVKLIAMGKRNRKMQQLMHGPAPYSTSAVAMFTLTQKEGDSPQQCSTLCSTLLMVETPSTHWLTIPQEELRVKYGPMLNRSLLSLVQVSESLSHPSRAQYAPFSTSKLTQIVQDYLGGNALVHCLACISRRDALAANQATMSLVQDLQQCMHFPVANTELVQGLLKKVQRDILRCQLANASEAVPSTEGSSAERELKERLHAMERDLLKSQLDASTASEDSAKLYKMLDLFKGKYAQLVKEKAEQSQDLIAAEESKLEVAKALVELRLEHSQLQEKAEAENFDVTSELLQTKNEVVNLQLKLQEVELLRDSHKRSMDTALSEKAKLEEGMAEASHALKIATGKAATKEGRDAEIAKAVELGAELLTLVNQKGVHEQVKAGLELKVAELSQKLAELDGLVGPLRESNASMMASLEEAKKKGERLDIERAGLELELKQVRFGQEQRVFHKDSASVANVHQREEALLEARMKETQELQMLRAENTQLRSAVESGRRELKREQREKASASEESRRRGADLEDLREQKAVLSEQLDSLRERFRGKLSELLTQETNEEEGGHKKRVVVQELVNSYKKREDMMVKDAQALKKANTVLIQRQRVLEDHASRLRGLAEDILPPEELPAPIPSLDGEVVDSKAEVAALAQRLRSLQDELAAQQEKNVNLTEEYSGIIRRLEQQQREAAQELGLLRQENEMLRTELSSNSGGATLKKLEEMQGELMSQLTRTSEHREGRRPKDRAADVLRMELHQVKEERDEALRRVERNQGGAPSKALLEQLQETERRVAVLLTRNTQLETELVRYKAYMSRHMAN